MRIAIISDVHNNLVNLKKVLDYCVQNNIKEIICCGDLASLETLKFLSKNFSGAIHYTIGNMDEDQLNTLTSEHIKKYKNIEIFKDFGEVEIDSKKIAFAHYPETGRKLCETGQYNFVFYGHTHKPWIETNDVIISEGQKKCVMLNPGNVAGEIYLPTFAVWNTEGDKFELIRVNDIK